MSGDEESGHLTFDAQFCGRLGEITPSLSNSHSTEYVLKFSAEGTINSSESTTQSETEVSCESGTRLTGGGDIPHDWETLVVSANGTQVCSVSESGQTPKLQSLPDPIGTRGGVLDKSGSPTNTSDISDDEATERALAAEEVYIRTQLEEASCTESWGLESYTGVETEATVSERTADGARVSVTHPYWYSTATTEADGASRATYLVTAEGIQRVDGDRIIRC